ncbi:MAG: DNA-binding protein [Dehalococcoidia bacterium]|nr:DNA-binding protein [Dehalococcoidia bacterium]
MGTPDGMVTVPEAAKRMGRSLEQVRRYLREGKLPGERIGNQWFIRETAVVYLVEPQSEEKATMEPNVRRTIHDMTLRERGAYIEKVYHLREAIARRWEARGVRVDVVGFLEEEREAH